MLVGFDGPLVVGIVQELRDRLLAYRGTEEPEALDEFLQSVTREIDSALLVALTLAILAGDQAAADAGTWRSRESETRLHSVPAACFSRRPQTEPRETRSVTSKCS